MANMSSVVHGVVSNSETLQKIVLILAPGFPQFLSLIEVTVHMLVHTGMEGLILYKYIIGLDNDKTA
jgi:hypothetical protein